tara:strand:- start:935 stop:1417 length:483 start_codon:yes stop_codon:yes gene_type:complete
MRVNEFLIIDDFVDDIVYHIDSIGRGRFTDVTDGVNVFKNIQDRELDIVSDAVTELLYNEYSVAHNFVRRSPEGQADPNFIHSDEMMGDLTCLLYLNEKPPYNDGTTIYNDDETTMAVISSKFNRMIIFDSKLKHSRNIFENFGYGEMSRQVQVIFLNKK